MRRPLLHLLFLGTVLLLAACARAADAEERESAARRALHDAILAPEETQLDLIKALDEHPSAIMRDGLEAWRRGGIYLHLSPEGGSVPFLIDPTLASGEGMVGGRRVDSGEPLQDAAGQPLYFQEKKLEPVDTSAKLRRTIKLTMDLLALSDPDPEARKNAILKTGMQQRIASIPLLEARLEKEKSRAVAEFIHEALALIQLSMPDEEKKVAALARLAEMKSIASKSLVQKLAESDEVTPAVKLAARNSLNKIEEHLFWVDFLGTIFRGVSLGSVLLVVALGLAITFGLMGVINMAHGEMMVVGGYATYLVQAAFGSGASLAPFGLSIALPGFGFSETSVAYQSYFIVALPVAFLSAAFVGLLLERSVIQYLYRRPLESLLATWGVSLVLQQMFRLIFGPANVPVYSPNWLLGSFAVNDVIMNYNRVFVIGFAVLIVLGTALLLARTPLGLFIRAIMQNREMASCMGVKTERVNMLTFAFGSGLAGLAGAFLSQIGNIGPSTGQTYIVDAFMVVVVGGVGNLVGTVISALGIGTIDQILQTLLRNPVIGKVLVLAGIILFLQWRPQGLFATRSRGLES